MFEQTSPGGGRDRLENEALREEVHRFVKREYRDLRSGFQIRLCSAAMRWKQACVAPVSCLKSVEGCQPAHRWICLRIAIDLAPEKLQFVLDALLRDFDPP